MPVESRESKIAHGSLGDSVVCAAVRGMCSYRQAAEGSVNASSINQFQGMVFSLIFLRRGSVSSSGASGAESGRV